VEYLVRTARIMDIGRYVALSDAIRPVDRHASTTNWADLLRQRSGPAAKSRD